MRIGGDFEIEPSFFCESQNKNITFLNQKNMYWVDLGRSAIKIAIEDSLNRGAIRKAYLPFYTCPSVLTPFKELNFEIEYYSMGSDLKSPNLINKSIETNSIFLFINYFGIENPVYKSLVDKKKNNHFFIIEDNVQAAFSMFNHSISDYKVYSFRKFLSIPDGALIIKRENFETEFNLEDIDKKFISDQIYGKVLRNEETLTSHFLELLKKSEQKLDIEMRQPRLMSDISQYMIRVYDIQKISEVRKKNWIYILKLLTSKNIFLEYLTPIFTSIEHYEIPLGFPIKVKEERIRDELIIQLRKENIYCPQHWKLNFDEDELALFNDDIELSKKILTIPIDQRMTNNHIKYFISKLEEILRSM